MRLSTLRASAVITDSQHSADQLCDAFARLRGRTHVIYLASSLSPEDAARPAVAAPRSIPPYFFAFGGASPHKNITTLVSAFRTAKQASGIAHQLVIAGHVSEEVRVRVAQIGGDVVRLTGYLPRGEVIRHLAGADALVFPSRYEGFGLPVIEAQTLGVPVICSDARPMPEIAGDAAAFFDPGRADDLARLLVRVAGDADLRGDLRRRGLVNAARFSWEATAAQTHDLYRAVVRRCAR